MEGHTSKSYPVHNRYEIHQNLFSTTENNGTLQKLCLMLCQTLYLATLQTMNIKDV